MRASPRSSIVRDINKDGYADIAIGEFGLPMNGRGRFVLFY